MFSTPFTASSMGVATERATTSALAPGYEAVTCTLGGAISGNCVTGNVTRDSKPRSTNMMDTTDANTGLSMNFLNMNQVLKSKRILFPPIKHKQVSVHNELIRVVSLSVNYRS